MSAVRQSIRDAIRRGLDCGQTLAEANRFLRHYDPAETATAIVGSFDTRRQRLAFANAGHPPPLMAGRCGTLYITFPESDLPLGVEPEVVPASHALLVPPETLLVFVTDGVSEHEQDALRGEIQLRGAARAAYRGSGPPAAVAIERLMSLGGSNRDDVAIMTVWTPRTAGYREAY